MAAHTACRFVAGAFAVVAVVVAVLVVASYAGPFGRSPVSTTPNHGQAIKQFGGSVGFTLDVTQVEHGDAGLVLHLRFHNASSQQQRADPAEFTLEGAGGWHASPAFDAPCANWGRVDLYPPAGGAQPLRDPGGTRAGATWEGLLCFPQPPVSAGALTLVWEPDVAFGPLSVPVRIPIR